MNMEELAYLLMAVFFACTSFYFSVIFALYMGDRMRNRVTNPRRELDPEVTARHQKIAQMFNRQQESNRKSVPVKVPGKDKGKKEKEEEGVGKGKITFRHGES